MLLASFSIQFLIYAALWHAMRSIKLPIIRNSTQILEHVTYHLPIFSVGVFAVVHGFRDQSHHGTVYALGQPIRGCKSCER